VTSHIGYIRVPLDTAAAGLSEWRRRLYPRADTRPVRGSRSDLVGHLEPLTGGSRARELLIATRNPEWTAYLE
jgi:hypothetical protein